MKRALAWLLVLVMLLSLAACGKGDDQSATGNTTPAQNQGNNAGTNEGNNGGTEAPPASNEGGSSVTDYTAAVDNLIQVMYNGKKDNLEGLAPEDFWKFYEAYGTPRSALLDQAEYTVEDSQLGLQYAFGESYALSYEIKSAEQVDADTLSKIAAAFKQDKGVDGITAVYAFHILVSVNGTPIDEFEVSGAWIKDNWYFITWNLWEGGVYGSFFIEGMISG